MLLTRLRRGILLIITAIGCGGVGSDAPPIAPVSGIVTVKGQPKADLNVVFHPEAGGRPATGTTGPDGKFTLTTLNTGDGAPVGTNKVTVSGGAAQQDWGQDGPPMPGMPGYDKWMQSQKAAFDPKYADPEKSGLMYTVPDEGLPNVEIKIP